MDRAGIGRISLRLDAAYCVLAALSLAAGAAPMASAFGIPVAAMLAVAAAALCWAGWMWRASAGARLRRPLVVVMLANVIGAFGLAVLGASRLDDALGLLALAVSLEVAAFAASQAVALRGLDATAS